MIEINLVPDVKQELIKAQRIRATVISTSVVIGFVTLAVVTLLSIYVFGVQTVRSSLADNDIKSGAAKLSSVQDLSKVLTIQNQLTQISTIHSSVNVDSRIFDVLAAIIPQSPNTVQISNVAVDSVAGTITIDGQAANSYAALDVFKKTINGAEVNFSDNQGSDHVALASNISTGSTSYGEDSTGNKVLRFTISFTYATELFAPSSNNVTVTVASNGNASDSALGIPTSIFVDRAKDTGTSN